MGAEGMAQLQQSHVLVVGLGGVGGYTAEMLARSGIGAMTIVDADVVQESNINRQLIALRSTIGQPKAQLWQERLLAINPELKLRVVEEFIKEERIEELLAGGTYHFAIDAIDTLSPKVHLIASLVEKGIPFISVMGTGAKLDPTQIRVSRMDKVHNCPLARALRTRLRKLEVPLKFPVVYSEELPQKHAVLLTDSEQNKKSTTGTIAYTPAVAGCYAAYTAINHLLNSSPTP